MKIVMVVAWLLMDLTTRCFAAETALNAKSFLNQPAPALFVEKWISTPPDLRGKFVLLDFWAPWCLPCRQGIPELNRFQKKFGDRLVVIGISSQPEGLVRAMSRPRIEYSSAIDTQARTSTQLEVTKIPHTLLIDPGGIVRWEGFPLATNHPLNDKVLAQMIRQWRGSATNMAHAAGLTVVGANPRNRVSLQLNDGRILKGQLIGTFGQHTALLTDDGKQIDLRNSQIISQEEVPATKYSPDRGIEHSLPRAVLP